jgi:hypothetical protein
MKPVTASLFAVLASTAIANSGGYSPLSTFYDIDVSTSASFFSGKSFGPGCARGGTIPDGFVAVAMNGAAMGLKTSASVCGMCVAIHGPAPSTGNPSENTGVCGEYYGYVYEVCEDCTQAAGIQLGVPGKGQSNVVWRAIPCPTKAPVSLFFDGSKSNRARFQVRGLSAPIISATVAGKELTMEKSFFVYENSTESCYPFDMSLTTALGEAMTITVPAFREYGDLSDLITVKKDAPARTTTAQVPQASNEFGSGQISTKSGPQSRTVATSNQVGRQVLTITNHADGSQHNLEQRPATDQRPAMGSPTMKTPPFDDNPIGKKQHASLYADSMGQAAMGAGNNLAYVTDGNDRKRIESFMNSPDFLSAPLGINDFGKNFNQVQMPMPMGGQGQYAGGQPLF